MENVIEIVKTNVNIDKPDSRNLRAAIIYSNWREGKILTNLEELFFKDKETGLLYNDEGLFEINDKRILEEFNDINVYGRLKIQEVFDHVDWNESFFKGLLNKMKYD